MTRQGVGQVGVENFSRWDEAVQPQKRRFSGLEFPASQKQEARTEGCENGFVLTSVDAASSVWYT